MSDFAYHLIVLTHGDSPVLQETLDSFREHVSPAPSSAVIVYDGPTPLVTVDEWHIATAPEPQGFCRATRAAWVAGGLGEHEFVFYLEHDFRFLREVDLRPIARVLDLNKKSLAQMSFLRGPINSQEREAGGVIGKHRARGDEFHERYYADSSGSMRAGHVYCWQEHHAFFTTNPSLMRGQFMRENPWPRVASQCEGKFGLRLRELGYNFGIWGEGDPWIEHLEAPRGYGY